MTTSLTPEQEYNQKLSRIPVQHIAELIGYIPHKTALNGIVWLHPEHPPVAIDGDNWSPLTANPFRNNFNTIDFLRNHCGIYFKKSIAILDEFFKNQDPIPKIEFIEASNLTNIAPEEFSQVPPYYGKMRHNFVINAQIANFSLPEALYAMHADPFQDNNKDKWKLSGRGNISVDLSANKWYNLNESHGSVGALSLVQHALSLNYREAKQWFIETFNLTATPAQLESPSSLNYQHSGNLHKSKRDKSFQPPTPNHKNLPFVKQYLHFNRGIPMETIEDLIHQNILYADDDRNCVFYSEGIAEIRSTFDGPNAIKQLAPGSSRVKGILMNAPKDTADNTLAICEGTITGISYHVLHPHHSVLSTAGANFEFPRDSAIAAYEKGLKIICAFDNDQPGHKTSQFIFNYFFLRTWIEDQYLKKHNQEIDLADLDQLFKKNTIKYIVDIGDEALDLMNIAPEKINLVKEGNLLFFTNYEEAFSNAEKSPPIILFSIGPNELGVPEVPLTPIRIPRSAFEYIQEEFDISRRLPPQENDWNDYLKIKNQQNLKLTNKI